MSTEYRRGIPSTAHVEAAMRLGLLWRTEDSFYRRFRVNSGAIEVQFSLDRETLNTQRWYQLDADIRRLPFRPIRPDGTLVDWEVLDQEVAGVGQQGQPLSQPEGFRADLFRRIASHFDLVIRDVVGDFIARIVSVRGLVDVNAVGIHTNDYQWGWGTTSTPVPSPIRADILARWTVYQELRPLYDLVDGAQGEAAMPRDVEAEWDRQSLGSAYNFETDGDWVFGRDSLGVFARSAESDVWRADPSGSQASLRNFAAVLDAVAERRVAERQASRGQTLREQLAELPQAVQAERAADEARRLQMEARLQPGPLAQPEPRRFADVRPDQHGWRWWRLTGRVSTGLGQRFETRDGRCHWLSAHADAWFVPDPDATNPLMLPQITIIPTDEQGNPVSWEAAGFAAEAVREAQESVQRAANDATPGRATHPPLNSVTVNGSAAQGWTAAEQAQTGHIVKGTVEIAQVSVSPSRFALIEIDDADPTAERIRQEQEAERHRLAELRQRLAAERAAQPAEETPATTSRFDLIEPDLQADPAASIRAWEARQAAAKVRPVAAPPRIAKPAAAPRRPAIEVVDAEVDGLSRSEVFAALFGRALNGGC